MTHDWSPERRAAIADGNFLKRLCAPDEIARMLAFFAWRGLQLPDRQRHRHDRRQHVGALMNGQKLRLALIGLGKQGLEHLNASDLCEDIVFVAGVNPSPETHQRVLESGNGITGAG